MFVFYEHFTSYRVRAGGSSFYKHCAPDGVRERGAISINIALLTECQSPP